MEDAARAQCRYITARQLGPRFQNDTVIASLAARWLDAFESSPVGNINNSATGLTMRSVSPGRTRSREIRPHTHTLELIQRLPQRAGLIANPLQTAAPSTRRSGGASLRTRSMMASAARTGSLAWCPRIVASRSGRACTVSRYASIRYPTSARSARPSRCGTVPASID
jgi:hypothetical protein